MIRRRPRPSPAPPDDPTPTVHRIGDTVTLSPFDGDVPSNVTPAGPAPEPEPISGTRRAAEYLFGLPAEQVTFTPAEEG